MSSEEDIEVYIPTQACVLTIPGHSLPSSITKKMSLCPVHTDRPAIFITPVELKKKGTNQKPRPLTSGQFFMPVITSNHKAFILLKNFLHSGEILLQFSDENQRAGCAFSQRKNSIVLFNKQIFLILKKEKPPDWPLEHQSSTTHDAGSDITKGQSKDGMCGAENHGKYAEKRSGNGGDVMPFETQNDDITDRRRNKSSIDAAQDHGKCAEMLDKSGCDGMNNGNGKNEAQTAVKYVSANTPSASEKSMKTEEEEAEGGVSAEGGDDQSTPVNSADYEDEKNGVVLSRGQSSHLESDNEIPDRKNDSPVPFLGTDNEDEIMKRKFIQVENLLIKVENLKRRINIFVNTQGVHKTERDDIATETEADCNDPIIIENDSGDMEVEPNQRLTPSVSDNKHQVEQTCAKSTRDGAASRVVGSLTKPGMCGAVEILDDDGDFDRNAEGSKSCSDAKAKVCPGSSDIVELDDDDEVIVNGRKVVNSQERRAADGATGRKRRLLNRSKDETHSDTAAGAAQTSEANVTSAKRSKHDDDVNLLYECAADPDSRGNDDQQDVEAIDLDDDDGIHRSVGIRSESCVNETKVRSNRANGEDSSGEVSRRKHDVEVMDLYGHQSNSAESQGSLETIRSCKRGISDGDHSYAQIIETEDSPTKHFKLGNVTHAGGKRWETVAEAQSRAETADPDELAKNAKCEGEKSSVAIVTVHKDNRVSCESSQKPNINETDSSNKTIVQTPPAEGTIGGLPSRSNENKRCKTAAQSAGAREDRVSKTNEIIRNADDCSKVQSESTSDEQNYDVTNESACGESYGNEVRRAAAGRRDLVCKSFSDEPDGDVKPSEVSGDESERGIEDRPVEEEKHLGVTDQRRDGVSRPKSHVLAQERLETTSQGACGEDVGSWSRPMSSGANQEFDYMALSRVEKINQLRVRLQVMEKELNRIQSHC